MDQFTQHKLERPNGCHVSYFRLERNPAKPPVLCIHGITSSSRIFAAFVRNLTDYDGSILAVDLRGRCASFEGTPDVSTYRGLDDHIDDLQCILAAENVTSCIVVGHSMGAFVAAYLAYKHPSLVRSMVLVDAGYPRDAAASVSSESLEGVWRSLARLDMTFETIEAYSNFWGANIEQVSEDQRKSWMHEYDAQRQRLRHCKTTVMKDVEWLSTQFLTAPQMQEMRVPSVVIACGQGFGPGTVPLISDETLELMCSALRPEAKLRVAEATHYTIFAEPHVKHVCAFVHDNYPSANCN